MNVVEVLRARAIDCRDRPAIVEASGRITFAELDARSAAVAAELVRMGLTAGQRAIVLSPMSIDLYVTIVGLFRIGVTAVFVDPSAGAAHLESCVSRAAADAFLGTVRAHLLRLTSPAMRAVPRKMLIGHLIAKACRAARMCSSIDAPLACADDTPAMLTFTTGSTGEPKAVVRSHGFLLAQHRAFASSLALARGDTELTALPIVVLANLASGVTSVIPDADLRAPGAIDPAPVVEQIQRLRPDRLVSAPALLERVVERAAEQRVTFDSLRRVFTGGAPVFPCVLDRIAAAAPLASVVGVYGSTEAEPIAAIDRAAISAADRAAMHQGRGLLAGRPASSIRLRILPDRWGSPVPAFDAACDFELSAVAPGVAGEIVVSGDHVLGGYLDGTGDAETKIQVADRVWHRTGDAGHLDEDGRLWLLGRCSARIADREQVLYPFAVECAASGMPGLRRSALVALGGQRILAIESNDSARIRPGLLRHLAWARLSDVVAVDRIPLDHRHNSKIDYPGLRQMLGA